MYSSIQVASQIPWITIRKKGPKNLLQSDYNKFQEFLYSYSKNMWQLWKNSKKTFNKEILRKDIFKVMKYTEKTDVCGIVINLV